MDHEELVAEDIDTIKERVSGPAHRIEHDIDRLIELEKKGDDRDHLVEWLEEKRQRRDLMQDEERIIDLLSHIEEAYRTAAISEAAYHHAKQVTMELLD